MLEAALPQDRAAQRRRLGSLKELTVQPATKKRYAAAVQNFFTYLKTLTWCYPNRSLNWTGWWLTMWTTCGAQELVEPRRATLWQGFRISNRIYATIYQGRGDFSRLGQSMRFRRDATYP